MRVIIMGAGGVGGYFGGRLAHAGYDVTFIARGAHLAAMQARGLRVDSDTGDFVVWPIQAAADPACVGMADVVLVTTKTWQVGDAARALRPTVGPETIIIPLLNGVEAPYQLADELGRERVLGGFCRVLSYVTEPGRIIQRGVTPFVAFGELDAPASSHVDALRQLFESADVFVQTPPDIRAAMWRKFAFVTPLGGVGAVTRRTAGQLRAHHDSRAMLCQAVEEVALVGRGHGVNLPENVTQMALNQVDALPADAVASMHRDILEGRPSELESQNGAVVRLAAEVGVATPVNQLIYETLLPLEKRARSAQISG